MIDFSNLIEGIKSANNIGNGFYYPDNNSFIDQGISDKYSAYFYLRHTDLKNKYNFSNIDDNGDMVSSRMRIVFSLSPSFCDSDTLHNLVNMLKVFHKFEDLILISATNEIESIYELEHGRKLDGRFNNNLFSIDFTVSEVIWKTSPNCLSC